jgi:hypothetical protein
VLDVEGAIGITFEGLHMEGLKLTGFNPTFVSCANSKIAITSFEIDNCVIQSGNITGVAKVFRDYAPQGSNITVENLNFVNFASGNVTASIVVMSPDAPATDFGAYSIRGMSWTDQSGTNIWAGNVSLDSHQPTSSSQFLTPEHVGNYQYGVSGSLTDAAVIFVSSTYNHYGQLRAATLFVPASITSFVLTLMATMGATGTQPPPTGAICTVIRESGTASGTLTVKDDAGTTLTTNTTSATSYTYMFNGTHFIAITPVT